MHIKKKFFLYLVAITRRMPNSWAGKRLAFAIRRIALIFVDSDMIEIKTFGVDMALCPRGNVAEKRLLFTPQYFDVIERNYLLSAIKDNFVFFDVGANIGGYSLFVASYSNPNSVIVAIEPQPGVKDRLRANCERNNLKQIRLIDSAVSDLPGTMPFYIHEKNAGESGLQFNEQPYKKSILVKVEPLLDIARNIGVQHIDALKIDVEGSEEPILTAFFNTAPESLFPHLLIIENGLDRWKTDLVSFICKYRYRVIEKTRLNLIMRREPSA